MINGSEVSGIEKQKVIVDAELEEIVPSFLQNRQKDIETIRESLETKDFTTIQRLGHIMKGAGGGYGFDRITEIGSSMEKAAKAQDLTQIENDLNALVQYLNGVEIVYQ
jgi:HPt (histidine-containing phosphotransfer) domain-containing protein